MQLAARVRTRQSNFAEAARLATAALELASDARLRAGIELDLVYCAVSLGDLGAARSHARAAVDDAEAAGEQGMLGDALAVLTMAEFLLGLGLDRAVLARALTLEDSSITRSWIMRPTMIRGMTQLWTGELSDALETLDAVHTESVERGLESFTPMLVLYRVWAAVWQGDLDRAAQLSRGGSRWREPGRRPKCDRDRTVGKRTRPRTRWTERADPARGRRSPVAVRAFAVEVRRDLAAVGAGACRAGGCLPGRNRRGAETARGAGRRDGRRRPRDDDVSDR